MIILEKADIFAHIIFPYVALISFSVCIHTVYMHMQCYVGLFHLHSRYVVQILVQSHFELVSLFLALEATEPVSEPVTQMAVELINNHFISVQ